jgi:hypothetical protein
MPHDRDDLKQLMGHVWQGFSHDDVSRWAHYAGLGVVRYHPLPAEPAAKGPTLFAAAARRPTILTSATSLASPASRDGDASFIQSAS